MGIADAEHEESAPDASVPLIQKLTCSLAGQEKTVFFAPSSKTYRIYGKESAVEVFACNYGLNEEFADAMENHDLRFTGRDEDGSVRLVELLAHRFFVATLFVPQILSERGSPHPVITAYVQSASEWMKR